MLTVICHQKKTKNKTAAGGCMTTQTNFIPCSPHHPHGHVVIVVCIYKYLYIDMGPSPFCCENAAYPESQGPVTIAARLTILKQVQRQRSSLGLTHQLPALRQCFKDVSLCMQAAYLCELKAVIIYINWSQRRRRIKVSARDKGQLLII